MLPNLRLIFVAMLASILAIACGMGLFATFRVNHEPLTRFAKAGPPLQLVFVHTMPVTDDAGAPFVIRLQADTSPENKVDPAPAISSEAPSPAATTPVDDQTATIAPSPAAEPAAPDTDEPAPPIDPSTAAPAAAQATADTGAPPEQPTADPVAAPVAPAEMTVEEPAHKPASRRRVVRRLRAKSATASAQPASQWTTEETQGGRHAGLEGAY